MTNAAEPRPFDSLTARLLGGATLLRIGATIVAGAVAVWAIGLALTLFFAVLVGSLALAAAVAAIALAGGLFARRKPEVVRAAAADILRRSPDPGMD